MLSTGLLCRWHTGSRSGNLCHPACRDIRDRLHSAYHDTERNKVLNEILDKPFATRHFVSCGNQTRIESLAEIGSERLISLLGGINAEPQ